jgi:uncharacterized protein (TIGR03435 family)
LIGLLRASAGVASQNDTAPVQTVSFDVASVRLTAPGTRGSQRITDSRVDFIGIALRNLLLLAFGAHPYEMVLPDNLDDVRVDVNATLPDGTMRAHVPAMRQALLRERFGLVTHVEPRRLAAYALRIAPGGIRMREVDDVDESAADAAPDPSAKPAFAVTVETIDGPYRSSVIPGVVGQRTIAGRSRHDRLFTPPRTTVIDATQMALPEMARLLSSNLDTPVLDRTGLTAVYRFRIELPPDASVIRVMTAAGRTTTRVGTSITEPTGVSTFAAVESLGLTLQRSDDPIGVVVVDRIARVPTDN